MLESVNDARSSSQNCLGTLYPAVPALSWSCRLKRAAQNHSDSMASQNFFSHTGTDGLSVGNRATNLGYNWNAIGENIAAGQRSVDSAMQSWLTSTTGHCESIMSSRYLEMGSGVAENSNSDFGIYWTQVFGSEFD